MEEIIKIKGSTFDKMLILIQQSKTNLSYQELGTFLQGVNKEYDELNPKQEENQEAVNG